MRRFFPKFLYLRIFVESINYLKMKFSSIIAAAALVLLTSCNMENPLLTESKNPYGAPQFDKIRNEHYIPAFRQGIEEAKAEIDSITANPAEPDFANTIEALEYSGRTLQRVAGIFYNLMEADTDDEMQSIAEEIAPMMTEYSMYVSLNKPLFERVKAVYMKKDSLDLAQDQKTLLEDTYRSFVRNGANLPDSDREAYTKYSEELSLATLAFGKNVLAATNAYTLNITDSTDLEGLPGYVVDMAAMTAREKGLEGWAITLDYPSFGPFMKFSSNRELRKEVYMAYMTRAVGGEFDNTETVRKIVDLRIKIAQMLGYETYADYALEDKMAKNPETVNSFLNELLEPSLPYAKEEIADIFAYAKENGFTGDRLESWDFSYWSEKYREAKYALNEELLKPYFRLENCIDAVFDLANRLYGLTFTEIHNVPVYHKDVKVYDVKDENGRHMALFYADFFPRASKRGGAWMTAFREQCIYNGVEERPFISIVTNFTKPTENAPSLLTHGEFTTLLHEFGHSLHGILAEGRYSSVTGTSVPRDFVELPSQIMENWAFEPEYLDTFAKDYRTGEVIPDSLITKIAASKNYLAAYSQVGQLRYGIMDMAWHTLKKLPAESTEEFEKKVTAPVTIMPPIKGAAFSPSFSHIFSGGYSAGYYSYKWSEVLEADAFSLFQEKGIFNKEVAASFRDNILSKGSTEDVAVLYKRFRGHNPQPEALLKKLGLADRK